MFMGFFDVLCDREHLETFPLVEGEEGMRRGEGWNDPKLRESWYSFRAGPNILAAVTGSRQFCPDPCTLTFRDRITAALPEIFPSSRTPDSVDIDQLRKLGGRGPDCQQACGNNQEQWNDHKLWSFRNFTCKIEIDRTEPSRPEMKGSTTQNTSNLTCNQNKYEQAASLTCSFWYSSWRPRVQSIDQLEIDSSNNRPWTFRHQ